MAEDSITLTFRTKKTWAWHLFLFAAYFRSRWLLKKMVNSVVVKFYINDEFSGTLTVREVMKEALDIE